MPKIFPTVIKVCQIEGNLKYEPKESCDNFSLPDLEKPMQIPARRSRKNFREIFLAQR